MFEIYSEVRAVLSTHLISAIEGCVMDIIKQCVLTANIEQVTSEDSIQYHLCGTLDGILIAKNKLEELLNSLQIKKKAQEAIERESTSCTLSEENSSFADDGPTSCDKDTTDKASCLSDDKEQTNGFNTEGSTKSLRLKPLSKKLRFILKERPRVSQRTRSARLALQLRTLKKKMTCRSLPLRPLAPIRNDPDGLSENLQQMKLCTDNSDFDSADPEGKRRTAAEKSAKEKDYEADSPYKHFCELCSFKTKRSSHFMKHMAIHEKVNTLYKCHQCSFTSVRLSHLRRHEMTHSLTVHACTQCLYKTDDIKFLLRHVRLKHRGFQADKNSSLILSCPHCSYQTTKQHYYDRHQRLHCSKRSFLHQCEQCCYKTHRKEHFVRHVNNVHGDTRPFLCHLCGKAFKRADALHQHHQTHTEMKVPESTSYKCSVCEKMFRSQSHLYEHQAVHSETRAFLCEMCGASFKTRSVHRKHVLSIHRNPRAYTCESCGKKFNTLYAMKRHRKTHSMKSSSQQVVPLEVQMMPVATEVDAALSNLKTSYTEPMSTFLSTPAFLQVSDMATEPSIAVDVAQIPFADTAVTTTEIVPQMNPPLFQTSDTTTALLYLTSGLPHFQ